MKTFLLTTLITSFMLVPTAFARTVEIEVHGMTCPFCVDSLERKFKKMESVNKVDVSLKLKKVRLDTQADTPTLDAIKEAVLDAGFTPIKVTVVEEDKKKSSKAKTKGEATEKDDAKTN